MRARAKARAGAPPQTEAAFQRQVRDLFERLGWKVHWTWNSKHSPAGFPDLVLVHPERGIVFAELKTERGKVTEAQADWQACLRLAGARAAVWRPADWERIVAVAQGGRP